MLKRDLTPFNPPKEIFDGVPSQHDGKDAAMIAELVAMGKGVLWPYSSLSGETKGVKPLCLRF